MKLKQWMASIAAAGLLTSGAAQASLINRGGGMIYDDLLNATWQQDANLAATNTFGVSGINADGSMSWSTANSWITAMNGANYLGYSDWQLPSSLNQDGSGPCINFGCNNSQMGELFYIEGGVSPWQSISSSSILASNFNNLQSDVYWSSTAYENRYGSRFAWVFDTSIGYQADDYYQFSPFYIWAVRSGDVAVTAAVPEPATLALAFTGLGLLGLSRRRRFFGKP